MKPCTLTLPWPVCVNHYKRPGRITKTASGKFYQPLVDTPETTLFYDSVWAKIYQMKLKEGLKSFGSATISVEVDAYPPDYRKRDLDGILKTLLDSMQRAGLYDDDYNIARLLVTRKDIIAGGQVIVRVHRFEDTKNVII